MHEIIALCQELGQMLGQATADVRESIRHRAEHVVAGAGVALLVVTSPVWGPFWLIGHLTLRNE